MALNQNTLRTQSCQKEYMRYLEEVYDQSCIFCAKDLLIQEFDLWILIQNRFPYDKVFIDHMMLAPKRHVEELYELTTDEQLELDKLFDVISHNMVILNRRTDRSIPRHFHFHLVSIK